jgi:hypothetical protein
LAARRLGEAGVEALVELAALVDGPKQAFATLTPFGETDAADRPHG